MKLVRKEMGISACIFVTLPIHCLDNYSMQWLLTNRKEEISYLNANFTLI